MYLFVKFTLNYNHTALVQSFFTLIMQYDCIMLSETTFCIYITVFIEKLQRFHHLTKYFMYSLLFMRLIE
jgi:hypothetical protein